MRKLQALSFVILLLSVNLLFFNYHFPIAEAFQGSIVGTTTTDQGTHESGSSHAEYSLERWWIFYCDGSNFGFQSSAVNGSDIWGAFTALHATLSPCSDNRPGIAISYNGTLFNVGYRLNIASDPLRFTQCTPQTDGTLSCTSPTTVTTDGTGLVAVESMNNGRPVILTRTDATNDNYTLFYSDNHVGSSWTNIGDICNNPTPHTTPCGLPVLTNLTNNRIMAVYVKATNDLDSRIFYDSNATFGTEVIIDSGVIDLTTYSIVTNSTGSVFAIYDDEISALDKVAVNSWTDPDWGATFIAEGNIADDLGISIKNSLFTDTSSVIIFHRVGSEIRWQFQDSITYPSSQHFFPGDGVDTLIHDGLGERFESREGTTIAGTANQFSVSRYQNSTGYVLILFTNNVGSCEPTCDVIAHIFDARDEERSSLVTSDTGASDGYVETTATSGTSCGTPDTINTAANVITVSIPASSISGTCKRGWMEFNGTEFAGGPHAELKIVEFRSEIITVTNLASLDVEIRELSVQPSTATSTELWNAIGSGTVLFDNVTETVTTGNIESVCLDQTESLCKGLETALVTEQGYYAIGLIFDSEVRDGSAHEYSIASDEDAGATPEPTLTIGYIEAMQFIKEIINSFDFGIHDSTAATGSSCTVTPTFVRQNSRTVATLPIQSDSGSPCERFFAEFDTSVVNANSKILSISLKYDCLSRSAGNPVNLVAVEDRQNATLATLWADAERNTGNIYLEEDNPGDGLGPIPCFNSSNNPNQQTGNFHVNATIDFEALLCGTDCGQTSQGGNWFSFAVVLNLAVRSPVVQADLRFCDSTDAASTCLDPAPTPNMTLVVTYTVPSPVNMKTFDAGADSTLATPSQEDGYVEALAASGAACGTGDPSGFVDDGILNVSLPATSISDRCSAGFVRVNIQELIDIHNGENGPIDIQEVRFQYDLDVATNMNSANVSFYAIDEGDPITQIGVSNVTLYNDLISGGFDLVNATNDETLGLHDDILTINAIARMQAAIEGGTTHFGIGIAIMETVRDSQNHVWQIASSNTGSGAEIPPRFKISYSTRNFLLDAIIIESTITITTQSLNGISEGLGSSAFDFVITSANSSETTVAGDSSGQGVFLVEDGTITIQVLENSITIFDDTRVISGDESFTIVTTRFTRNIDSKYSFFSDSSASTSNHNRAANQLTFDITPTTSISFRVEGMINKPDRVLREDVTLIEIVDWNFVNSGITITSSLGGGYTIFLAAADVPAGPDPKLGGGPPVGQNIPEPEIDGEEAIFDPEGPPGELPEGVLVPLSEIGPAPFTLQAAFQAITTQLEEEEVEELFINVGGSFLIFLIILLIIILVVRGAVTRNSSQQNGARPGGAR